MAVAVVEKFESRMSTLGKNASVEMAYSIIGTNDDIEAKTELLNTSPLTYDGLVRQSLSIERQGDELWSGTVRYGMFESTPPATGESSFSFETGGGTQHITQSIQTVGRYPATAPDFKGAIGVTHDAVEGVDIQVPTYQFAETHYVGSSQVNQTYKMQLAGLTSRVNAGSFRGFAAGEVLFLGASGSRRGTGAVDDWEISFKFAVSRNKTGISVGDISGIEKKGWEYLWVRYADDEDTTAKSIIKKPVGVYVEKVYESGDFSLLGI